MVTVIVTIAGAVSLLDDNNIQATVAPPEERRRQVTAVSETPPRPLRLGPALRTISHAEPRSGPTAPARQLFVAISRPSCNDARVFLPANLRDDTVLLHWSTFRSLLIFLLPLNRLLHRCGSPAQPTR